MKPAIPYWKRVRMTALAVATSWVATLPTGIAAVILAFAEFIGALLGLAIALVAPFTFLAAPLWLMWVERSVEIERRRMTQFKDYL